MKKHRPEWVHKVTVLVAVIWVVILCMLGKF